MIYQKGFANIPSWYRILVMNFKTYFRNLAREDREAYAVKAGTSANYIDNHLVSKNKIPRKKLMESLAAASNGKLSYSDIVDYFYKSEAA